MVAENQQKLTPQETTACDRLPNSYLSPGAIPSRLRAARSIATTHTRPSYAAGHHRRPLVQSAAWKLVRSPDATRVRSMPLLGAAQSAQTLSESHRATVASKPKLPLYRQRPARHRSAVLAKVIAAIASAHPAIELMEPAFRPRQSGPPLDDRRPPDERRLRLRPCISRMA